MDHPLLLSNGNLRVKSCRHGIFAYFINDTYIGRSLDTYGEYSEAEVDLFRQILKPGMTAVEVGSNIGAHTVFLACAVGEHGHVIAFEPQPQIFHLLCTNITLNNLMNVTTQQLALSNTPGSVTLPPLDYRAAQNFGAVELDCSHGDGVQVKVVTLDSLNLPRCDFIKADVEGMELKFLEGAIGTIDQFRPILYLENDRAEKSRGLIQFLFENNYRVFWWTTFLFNKNNFLSIEENFFKNVVAPNIICFPEESNFEVIGLNEITHLENSAWS